MAQQHAGRSQHTQLNLVLLGRLLVYPNANFLESLFHSRLALVLALDHIEAKWPDMVPYGVLHTCLFNLRQAL